MIWLTWRQFRTQAIVAERPLAALCGAGADRPVLGSAAGGAGSGIPAYWIVEPDPDRPRLIAFELNEGKYQTVADVTGSDEFRATLPFPVAIRPAVLTRTGPLT
jgi:hypothetical protein